MTPASFVDDLLSVDLGDLPPAHIAPVGKIKKLLEPSPTHPDDYILHMDHTSLEAMNSCDKIGLWRFIYSRTSYPSAAIIYGQAVHAGLEELYRHGPNLSSMLEKAEEKMQRLPPSVSEWRNSDALQKALSGYLKRYPTEPFVLLQHNNELCVEQPFRDELGRIVIEKELAFSRALLLENETSDSPLYVRHLYIVWTGVIDLLVEQQGRIRNIDHKTSSMVGPSYYDQWTISQQMIGYTRSSSKILGQPVEGTLLNVIVGRKPTRSGNSLEFNRAFFAYPQFMLDEWQDDILALLTDFVDRLVVGHFPKSTVWCVGKYGTCPYLPVCQLPPSERLELLFSDQFANNVWDPLNKD